MKNDGCLILLKFPVANKKESDTISDLPPMAGYTYIFLKEKHGSAG